MGTTTMIVLGAIAVLLLYGVAIFNKLVSYQNRYKNAFAQIEVQLKRRYDLIPNLIEVAKKYMAHERETLEAVVNARNAAQQGLANAAANPADADALRQLNQAEGQLAGALGKFNVVVEAYPELKANENMLQLSEELTSTENRVAFARQAFNDAATLYNEYRQSFPQVVLAPVFGHNSDAQLLQFEDSAAIAQAPKVAF